MKEYPCPVCGDAIEFDGNDITNVCKSCNTLIQINYDAEFVDGMWRDRSILNEVTS
jgi:hypothetical protein